ncbi:toxin-antitoxin system YwqK family antitoxin [Streptomyces sp. NPDC018693]|uniref:toxin-antitoxin system YwqK family antitoxin n=1 Tax=unclassified Streptomyces TaxID=2593676 RepID=UPI00378E13B4
MRRIDIDGPGVDIDRSLRLLYQGELFTGEAVEYLGGALVSLESYQDGLVHGPSREWYPGGALASEKEFADDGELVSHRAWDESGRLVRCWSRMFS